MMNLDAKLHLGVNEIVVTIKCGLLDHIRMQAMITIRTDRKTYCKRRH